MYFEDDHQSGSENDEGCCGAMVSKLRENRRVLVVTLLLVATMAAIAKGMYDAITTREYNYATIAVGILLPSIIIIIICIYTVIDYTRHPSSRTSSRVHYSANRTHFHSCEDIAHRSECLENRINVNVEQHLSVSGSPAPNQSVARTVEIRPNEFRSSTQNPPVSCKIQKCPKISRSCSDLDISRNDHSNNEMAHGGRSCKKHENSKMSLGGRSCKKHENGEIAVGGHNSKKNENDEYSTKCTEHRRVQRPIGRLQRCLSDSSCKHKNAESEQRMEERNFKLPDNFKQHERKEPTLKVQKLQSDYKDRKFKESIKNIPSENHFYPPKNSNGNFKSSKVDATGCDAMDGNEMYAHRDKKSRHVSGNSFRNVTRENVDSPTKKRGIVHLSKTWEEKYAHGEPRQPLHFSHSAQAQRDNFINRSEKHFFTTDETRYQYKQYKLRSKFRENEKLENCTSWKQSTETKNCEKGETIYFSSHYLNFLQYPGHARQEHTCLPGNDELSTRLSPRKNESTDCHLFCEQKEKEYPLICNTNAARLSPRTKENEDYHSMSDTRERKYPAICYVEKRLSSINKGQSDGHSTKEPSMELSSKSENNRNRRTVNTVNDPREKRSAEKQLSARNNENRNLYC